VLASKFIKFFNTPLVTNEVRATFYKVLFSLSMLVNLVFLGSAIAVLLETFQLLGYDGDMIVLSLITISSPIIICMLCFGELVPRYKPSAKQASRCLILLCALTMIANTVTQHF
jgi:hypothetical protein